MKLPYYFIMIYFTTRFYRVLLAISKKVKRRAQLALRVMGSAGVSMNPEWPKLAGQHAKYLETQLYEFQKGPDGTRNNAIMYGIALALSKEDIEIYQLIMLH